MNDSKECNNFKSSWRRVDGVIYLSPAHCGPENENIGGQYYENQNKVGTMVPK